MPKQGDTVKVHYKGTLADGSTFDSSEGREPLEFTVGAGQVIPGFDSAVEDLAPGESKTVTIPADEAYGPHDPEALRVVPREMFGDQEPQPGWMVELGTGDPNAPDKLMAVIDEVRDDEVVLDFNHPLAGQDLTFDITLVEADEA